MKFVELIECELIDNKMVKRATCYVNPKKIEYIEGAEKPHKGYSYVGLGRLTTIVKGTPEEIIAKIKENKWLKILRLQ
jgi:hypothetical protein